MDGIRIILLIVAVLIVLYNLFIHFANLAKIITFCFKTNTLDQYWTSFFKSLSLRAIFSSVFGLIIGLVLFLIITPIILIRRLLFKSKHAEQLEKGLIFNYEDKDLEKLNKNFHTNISDIGFKDVECKITGKIRIDALMILSLLSEKAKNDDKQISYKVQHQLILTNNDTATIPLFITLDNKDYPVYLLYNQEHINQFKKIKSTLYNSSFKTCIYFSTERF